MFSRLWNTFAFTIEWKPRFILQNRLISFASFLSRLRGTKLIEMIILNLSRTHTRYRRAGEPGLHKRHIKIIRIKQELSLCNYHDMSLCKWLLSKVRYSCLFYKTLIICLSFWVFLSCLSFFELSVWKKFSITLLYLLAYYLLSPFIASYLHFLFPPSLLML